MCSQRGIFTYTPLPPPPAMTRRQQGNAQSQSHTNSTCSHSHTNSPCPQPTSRGQRHALPAWSPGSQLHPLASPHQQDAGAAGWDQVEPDAEGFWGGSYRPHLRGLGPWEYLSFSQRKHPSPGPHPWGERQLGSGACFPSSLGPILTGKGWLVPPLTRGGPRSPVHRRLLPSPCPVGSTAPSLGLQQQLLGLNVLCPQLLPGLLVGSVGVWETLCLWGLGQLYT